MSTLTSRTLTSCRVGHRRHLSASGRRSPSRMNAGSGRGRVIRRAMAGSRSSPNHPHSRTAGPTRQPMALSRLGSSSAIGATTRRVSAPITCSLAIPRSTNAIHGIRVGASRTCRTFVIADLGAGYRCVVIG